MGQKGDIGVGAAASAIYFVEFGPPTVSWEILGNSKFLAWNILYYVPINWSLGCRLSPRGSFFNGKFLAWNIFVLYAHHRRHLVCMLPNSFLTPIWLAGVWNRLRAVAGAEN